MTKIINLQEAIQTVLNHKVEQLQDFMNDYEEGDDQLAEIIARTKVVIEELENDLIWRS